MIALCLSDDGPPKDFDGRIEIAARLVDRLTGDGVPLENIYVDPCVFPISTGSDVGNLRSRRDQLQIHSQYPGVHTICGASNVSFGLPVRKAPQRDLPGNADRARSRLRHHRPL